MFCQLSCFGAFLAGISSAIAQGNQTTNATQIIESQTLDSPSVYDFPVLQNGNNSESGQFPMPLCNGFTLEEATIDQLQDAMSTGKLTSVQIALCYLQRIMQTDEYIR
jgi:amidase